MTTELAKVERRIYRVAVLLAGLMLKRAVLRADVVGLAACSARLQRWIDRRQDAELRRADNGNDCFFCIAAELDADAIALRESLQ